jgi:threonine aldolase
VDGARLLNAATALGVEPASLVSAADSVSLCLSKGLAAPVGSVIVGTADFIRRAKRLRKALGGGMRQCGILAAAGLLSITEMYRGLKTDHVHAQQLVDNLRQISGIRVPSAECVQSNIIFVEWDTSVLTCNSAQLREAMKAEGVLIGVSDTFKCRLVTHYHIDDQAVEKTNKAFKKVLETFRKSA